MQPPLQMLSAWIERDRICLTADDLDRLDGAFRDFLLRERVLVRAENADHVACDACHEHHVEQVCRLPGTGTARFRIYCPHAGWTEVPPHRLQQWRVDRSMVAGMLSRLIGTANAPETVVARRLWWLGTLESGGGNCNVYFAIHQKAVELSTLGRATVAKRGRSILIVPRIAESPQEGFVATVALGEAFRWDGTTLVLQEDRLRAALPVEGGEDAVFRREGETYRISYAGHSFTLRQSVGLDYLAELLCRPRQPMPAVTLLATRAGVEAGAMKGSSGKVLDSQARREYEARGRELMCELEDARACNDMGRIEACQEELDKLARELAKATGLGGRDREKRDADKVRKSVSVAVKRAVQNISKHNKELGRHFEASLTYGSELCYSPEREVNWCF